MRCFSGAAGQVAHRAAGEGCRRNIGPKNRQQQGHSKQRPRDADQSGSPIVSIQLQHGRALGSRVILSRTNVMVQDSPTSLSDWGLRTLTARGSDTFALKRSIPVLKAEIEERSRGTRNA